MKKYHKDLTILQYNYERLENEIKKAIEYYTTHEVPKIAPYTHERFEIEMPEIDFSDIHIALEQIYDSLEFVNKSIIWKEMFKLTSTVLYNARKDFILDAIAKIPNNKNVVVIKSSYIPKENTKSAFKKQCIELANNPSSNWLSIRCMFCAEWIAFCPSQSTDKQIEEIIKSWHGEPAKSNISYL